MPRGITQDQVNTAADAILGDGENPTVEKVRARLGTGSPNTVTRMLEVWRGLLGERLRRLSALPEVPGVVGQAMVGVWQLAVEHAERAVGARLAEERAGLEAARAALMVEQEGWEARLQAAETRVAQVQAARDLAEHACATLDGQLQDSHALRADLLQQRDRLQEQVDQQSEQMQALRVQLGEHQAAWRDERTRQEAHVQAVEDRAHQAVDRARLDAKQWQQRLETVERTHRDAMHAAQQRHDALGDQRRQLEQDTARLAGQVAALERALSEAYAAAPAKRKEPPKTSKAAMRGERKKGSTQATGKKR